MATADEYAAWIVANQDKKDTPEFGTVAEAYKLAKSEGNAPAAEAPKENAAGGIGRQLGLAARYGIEGAAGIPGMFINPFQQAAGVKTMAQATSDLLTKFGLPKEQTGAEQLSGAISRAMAGGGGISALASRLPQLAGSVAPLIQSALTQQPMAQVVQSGLGGGAAETVRQQGGGELAQFMAGLGVPLAAGIATSSRQRSLPPSNPVRDATIGTAQDAGYVFPPSQVNPSFINRMAEGFAGKLTTAQQASQKNQNVTNTLAKQAIGLPPDASLNVETFGRIRADAGKAYAAVSNLGPISADATYANVLDQIATRYDKAHGGMKSLRIPEVETLLKDASKVQLDSGNAVEFVKNLRDNGFGNKASQSAKDKLLGKTQIDIANAVEDLLDRAAVASGQPEVVANYRDARQLIAKTYTVQDALNPGTGNVIAGKLANVLRRGKPITDELKTVAEASNAFPKATADITTSLPGVSPLDYAAGIIPTVGAIASGHPMLALGSLAPFMRPAVRSGILSGPYQRKMVQAPERAIPQLPLTAQEELMRRFGGLLGYSASRQ